MTETTIVAVLITLPKSAVLLRLRHLFGSPTAHGLNSGAVQPVDNEPLSNTELSSFQNPEPQTLLRTSSQQAARLALWEAAGAAQSGDLQLARQSIGAALSSGADRNKIAQLLVGSTFSSLARASVFKGDTERSLLYFQKAQDLNAPGGDLPYLDLLMGQAKEHDLKGQYLQAYQTWQDIACLLGEKTPDYIFVSMGNSQARVPGFGGTELENKCWGDMHKHDVLSMIHSTLNPNLYLEVGVDEGLSLARAKCPSVGVDPRPSLKLKVELPSSTKIIPISSDKFFGQFAKRELTKPIDLAFIDGMHLFEFALRDFMNTERLSSPYGLIVIDDIYPCHPTQVKRHRQSGSWTGDIWKMQDIIKEYRPELFCMTLNCWTTGLLLVAGLDPESRVLEDSMPDILRRYRPISNAPLRVFDRHGAIPSSHSLVSELLLILAQARAENLPSVELKQRLHIFKEKLSVVESEYEGRARELADPDASKSKLPLEVIAA